MRWRKRRSKHGATKTVVHGITFASQAEARRYQELLLMGLAGKLTDLEIQPRFPIVVNGQRVCDYVADFRYRESLFGPDADRQADVYMDRVWIDVVEDVKSAWTRTLPVYRLKKKLMSAVYDIEVYEYGAGL